jgi:hypothetical protein
MLQNKCSVVFCSAAHCVRNSFKATVRSLATLRGCTPLVTAYYQYINLPANLAWLLLLGITFTSPPLPIRQQSCSP